jgi:hypothetical protein
MPRIDVWARGVRTTVSTREIAWVGPPCPGLQSPGTKGAVVDVAATPLCWVWLAPGGRDGVGAAEDPAVRQSACGSVAEVMEDLVEYHEADRSRDEAVVVGRRYAVSVAVPG